MRGPSLLTLFLAFYPSFYHLLPRLKKAARGKSWKKSNTSPPVFRCLWHCVLWARQLCLGIGTERSGAVKVVWSEVYVWAVNSMTIFLVARIFTVQFDLSKRRGLCVLRRRLSGRVMEGDSEEEQEAAAAAAAAAATTAAGEKAGLVVESSCSRCSKKSWKYALRRLQNCS